MDFSLPSQIDDLRMKTRTFIADEVMPVEADRANWDAYEMIAHDPLEGLRAKARQAGLWSPQMPVDRGGMGLGVQGMAALYEESNYSLFGPVAMNCAAPDDGNMMVLNKLGREDQKEKWLQPIIDGKVRSAFAMTEPAPGGGSDPSMIQTKAERSGNMWKITGRKWYITGAGVASHFILMAKTSDDTRKGLTAFLFHKDDPGWHIARRIPIMGPEEHGGHCELIFDGLEIPDQNRLMEVGDGLKVTQIRLGVARLTHCMRWLGLSQRCLDIARTYVEAREGFGIKLAERESVQLQLGEAAMAVEIGRMLTMRAAWALDQGSKARQEVSMAKIQVADTLHKCADTAIQLNGARGYSKDTVLEWIYRYARQARLVDGASEVHKMVINRFLSQQGRDFFRWGPGSD
ncbi:MAG: acyl-CoA dehydrogenase family protein [Pseudomonadota bacterium]